MRRSPPFIVKGNFKDIHDVLLYKIVIAIITTAADYTPSLKPAI